MGEAGRGGLAAGRFCVTGAAATIRRAVIKISVRVFINHLHLQARTNRRLNSRLLRRRLAPRASRELLDPYIRSMPAAKALAGHRALSLTALIVTAKSLENTRKIATLPEACQCAPVFPRNSPGEAEVLRGSCLCFCWTRATGSPPHGDFTCPPLVEDFEL